MFLFRSNFLYYKLRSKSLRFSSTETNRLVLGLMMKTLGIPFMIIIRNGKTRRKHCKSSSWLEKFKVSSWRPSLSMIGATGRREGERGPSIRNLSPWHWNCSIREVRRSPESKCESPPWSPANCLQNHICDTDKIPIVSGQLDYRDFELSIRLLTLSNKCSPILIRKIYSVPHDVLLLISIRLGLMVYSTSLSFK